MPKFKYKSQRTRKVVVAYAVTIQGKTEALVYVFIERTGEDYLDSEVHHIIW